MSQKTRNRCLAITSLRMCVLYPMTKAFIVILFIIKIQILSLKNPNSKFKIQILSQLFCLRNMLGLGKTIFFFLKPSYSRCIIIIHFLYTRPIPDIDFFFAFRSFIIRFIHTSCISNEFIVEFTQFFFTSYIFFYLP